MGREGEGQAEEERWGQGWRRLSQYQAVYLYFFQTTAP